MKYLRAVGRWIRNYFVFIGVMVTLLSILFMINISRSLNSMASYELPDQESYELTLNLSGEVSSSEPLMWDLLAGRFFGGGDIIYLPEVRRIVRAAKADAKVKKVLINIDNLAISAADAVDLRRTLGELKGKDREIVFSLNQGDTWHYYLATVGDRIVLNPAASLFVTGPYFNLVYMGDLLKKKIGFELQVYKAGKYKSAFEPFITNEPSDATLEEYQAMEASLRTFLASEIAVSRNVPVGEAKDWLATGVYTALESKQAGLIDEVGYAAASPEAVLFFDYGKAVRDSTMTSASLISSDDGIGLIDAQGEVAMSGNDMRDESINPQKMTKELMWMKEKAHVKAVVLRIDSPGGSAVAADMIWAKVKELAAVKPVVVSMGDVAASGGYYIAAPAKQIFAEPTTITGSIGVIAALPNLASFREKWGVSFHIVTQSLRKNLLDPGSAPTVQDVELLNRTVDQVYDTFLAKVSEGRGLDLAKVADLAQGRVYTGLQAKELGLVDQIGGVQEAFKEAKKLGGLDPEKLYPVHSYSEDSLSLSECFRSPMRCLKGRVGVLSALDRLPLTEEGIGQHVVSETSILSGLKRWSELFRPGETLLLWGAYETTSSNL